MTFKTALTATTAALLLSGCANGTFGGFLLGGGISIADAEAANDALVARVDDIIAAEGFTETAQLPTTGTASYTGIIQGDLGSGGTAGAPDMEYYADLSMDADFATDTIDGEVTNFVTNIPGFLNPTGTATVTGTIFDAGGTAGNDFDALGTLVGTSATADYDAEADGVFDGDSAQAAHGTHITNFIWTAGPNMTTTSFSDGDWNIEE